MGCKGGVWGYKLTKKILMTSDSRNIVKEPVQRKKSEPCFISLYVFVLYEYFWTQFLVFMDSCH